MQNALLSLPLSYPGGANVAKDLTTAAVRNAKPKDGKRTEFPDGKSRGLFLVVQPSGTRSWALRFRMAGKPKKATIGPAIAERPEPVTALPLGEPHTLAEARIAADRLRLEIAHGNDPTARTVRADTITVHHAVEMFIEDHAKAKNRSWAETDRQFNAYVLPAIGERSLSEVTGDDLRKLVRAIKRPTMANRLHATLSKWSAWCADRERKLMPENPYSGFDKPHKESSRDRVLSDEELASLWTAATTQGGHFGKIVRLLILTGQRRSEVTEIVRSEIDFKRREWTIPAERAKNGNKTVVPLSAAAMAELASFEGADRNALLFSTNGRTAFSGHQKCKDRLDRNLQFAEPWRLHDIRRTVATGLARLHVPQEVTEAILNHASGKVSGVAGVYIRHDYATEKRSALTLWSHYVQWLTDDAAQRAFQHIATNSPKRSTDQLNQSLDTALRSSDNNWQRFIVSFRRFSRIYKLVSPEMCG